MKTCTYCSREVEDNTNFCPDCGKPFNEVKDGKKKKRNIVVNNKLISIFAGIFCIFFAAQFREFKLFCAFAVVVGAALLVNRKNSKDDVLTHCLKVTLIVLGVVAIAAFLIQLDGTMPIINTLEELGYKVQDSLYDFERDVTKLLKNNKRALESLLDILDV